MAAAVNLLQQVREAFRPAAHDKKRALHIVLLKNIQDLRQVFVAPGHIDHESNSLPRGIAPLDHRVGIVRGSDCGAQLLPDRGHRFAGSRCHQTGQRGLLIYPVAVQLGDDYVVCAVVDGVHRIGPVLLSGGADQILQLRVGRLPFWIGVIAPLARFLWIHGTVVIACIIFIFAPPRIKKSRPEYDAGGKRCQQDNDD